MPISLYDDDLLEVIAYDENGRDKRVKTYVFRKDDRNNFSFRIRLFRDLEKELIKNHILQIDRIGKTKLMLANLEDVVSCAQDIITSGRLPTST